VNDETPKLPETLYVFHNPTTGRLVSDGRYWLCDDNPVLDGCVVPVIAVPIDTTASAKLAKVEAELTRWKEAVPAVCPITNRPFFMLIEDEQGVPKATYGGPLDSYTIPEIEDYEKGTPLHERSMTCRRYDHDAGAWVEGCETIDIKLINEQVLMRSHDDDGELITHDRLEKVEAELERVKAERDTLVRLAWTLTYGFSNTAMNAITNSFQCGGGRIPADAVARIRQLANLPATGEKDGE
jgi:hypothetical protein